MSGQYVKPKYSSAKLPSRSWSVHSLPSPSTSLKGPPIAGLPAVNGLEASVQEQGKSAYHHTIDKQPGATQHPYAAVSDFSGADNNTPAQLQSHRSGQDLLSSQAARTRHDIRAVSDALADVSRNRVCNVTRSEAHACSGPPGALRARCKLSQVDQVARGMRPINTLYRLHRSSAVCLSNSTDLHL